MRRLRAVMLIVLCEVFVLLSCALSEQGGYPWVYYFERPDFPEIHCAFADAEGNVIVATGDWNDGWGDWGSGDYVHTYWSEGMFRIREDEIEGVECPARTLVLDLATDSAGRTWVLFGEGLDYRVHVYDPPWRRGLMLLDSAARPPAIANRRIGLIENGRVAVDDELTKTIPAEPFVMASDPQGRIYVMSQELRNNVSVEFFISWWEEDPSVSLHVLDLHDILPNAAVADYPQFGPDGVCSFLVRYPISGHTEYAVLALDPASGEHHVYFGADYPLLNSAIRYFHVDSMNVKWFGTEDGLVRFDGETWMRYTTENSGLPYNLVRQIVYDEADDVYYAVCQHYDSGAPDYYAAFVVLSSDGQRIGPPFELPDSTNLWIPTVQRAGEIWYLMPYVTDDLIYSYDHTEIREWHLRHWVNVTGDVFDLYIGPTSDGRTFLVTRECVMIW